MVVSRRFDQGVHRADDEDGFILILAMVFLTIAGFLVIVPLRSATISAHAASTASAQRSWEYDAEATAESYAQQFAADASWGVPYDTSCHSATYTPPNGSTITTTCLGLVPSTGTQVGLRQVALTMTATVAGVTQTALTTVVTFHDLPAAGNEVDLSAFSAVHS